MKTVFNYNTPVSAEWFNVINGFRLRFDGNPLLPGDLVDGQYLPIRLQDLDPAILAPYVQAVDVVNTTGNQVINGFKVFTEQVEVPTATNQLNAINKAQLDAAVSTLNAAITAANVAVTAATVAAAALDAATVKLTTAQTIAGVKTFSSSPLVPVGSTASAAVNFAQLSALTQVIPLTNCLKIGNKQIIWGATAVTGDWGAGGAVAYAITFSSSAPTRSAFTSVPVVSVVTDRLLAIQADPSVSGISGFLDQAGISQPNNCILYWIAIGSI